MRRSWGLFVVLSVLIMSLAAASASLADGITNSGDDLRTGWYPNAKITPEVVTGGQFGQLWSAPVNGQVYAQPLVSTTTANGQTSETVVVATETNHVYGFDPTNHGAQRWNDSFDSHGVAWNPADLGCADITPAIGTTATPVIDPSTNTVYVTHKVEAPAPAGAAWYLDALDVTTGAERPGFPVKITGNADNAPSVAFNPKTEQQRPGLLLMNGVIYMGFGGHCDVSPWAGWIVGVSTTTANITAMWVDNPAQDGAGIWQSGVGLMSDGPNTLLLTTGNGGSPTTPTPGSSPPSSFGESVVRLNVGADGKLTTADFFAPFDATNLDTYDADFGSGGIVGLPDQYFGTTAYPHLAVAVGKEGLVYLFNRDSLGGFEQGPGAGDNVIQRLGPFGGVWGRPGVWPGDGGYVYIPTSTPWDTGGLFDVYKYGISGTGAAAKPALSTAGATSDTLGWGSGSPVITSDGTRSGSALVWIVWSADRTGANAQLRAYNPIPVNGKLVQVYQASIGTSTNYSMPGVGNDGRLYIGTRDGHLLAFGSPVTQPVSADPLNFPATTDGTTSPPQTLTLTANEPVKVSSITASAAFSVDTSQAGLPKVLNTGDTLTVPVTFSPTASPAQTGLVAGQLSVDTDSGPVSVPVSGIGQAAEPQLDANASLVSVGGTAVGGHLSGTVTFSNDGNAPVTITGVDEPTAPFSVIGAPSVNDVITPGQSVTAEIDFNPTSVGQFSDELDLTTADGEDVVVGLAGSASTPGALQFDRQSVEFGSVAVGATSTRTFTLTNTGGTNVSINKSKPPLGGDFSPVTQLNEGTVIPPGQSVTETVSFTPQATGPATAGTWAITGDDGSGLHEIQFTGTGVTPGALQVSAPSIDFGSFTIGQAESRTFAVSNIGQTAVTITNSAPPGGGVFAAASQLATGTVIGPGASLIETVAFRPSAAGPATADAWTITGDDGSGPHRVQFAGSGVAVRGLPPIIPPPHTGPTGSRSQPMKAPVLTPRVTTMVGLRHTIITYSALVARTSTFTIQRQVSGRRSGGRCVAATARNQRATSCTRWVTVATYAHHDRVGTNRLALTSIAAAGKLTSGTYRLQSVLLDAHGARHVFTTPLRIMASKG
jgi:hypothetical protein